MSSTDRIASIVEATQSLSWQERLRWIAAQHESVTFSTSLGLEDQLITHFIAENQLPISIFTLDTGRLFEQTYALLQQTERHYGIKIKTYHPDAQALEHYIAAHGVNGFYDSVENRKACCHIRKVEPMQRALQAKTVWISGLRRDHSSLRAEMPVAEWNDDGKVVKFYPLIDVPIDAIREQIAQHRIPYNPLHDQGFPSIGCAPCTRAVAAGEHPRSGRWWWEENSAQECGLHLVDGKLVRKMEPKHV